LEFPKDGNGGATFVQLGFELKVGDVVYIRYRDHVLFKDVNPDAYEPCIRETVGWLAEENIDYIKIVWDKFSKPLENAKQRATGLVILRPDILVLSKVR